MKHLYYMAIALASVTTVANTQAGPNTLAQHNSSNRTASFNATFCILPIPKAVIRKVTHGFEPLDVYLTILSSFPEDMHPLLLQAGYMNDIRMTALNIAPLQIAGLMAASLIVPYTDATRDGKTAINVQINGSIRGTHGRFLEALVPAIVGAIPLFEGTILAPATTVPDTSAAQSLSNGSYSFEVKPYILPNPIFGPSVSGEAIDLAYSLASTSPYTAHSFHSILNAPQLLDNGLCQRFQRKFRKSEMAVGNVTLYDQQLLSTPSRDIAKVCNNVHCYQANAELVASYIGETCLAAAARADPSARV